MQIILFFFISIKVKCCMHLLKIHIYIFNCASSYMKMHPFIYASEAYMKGYASYVLMKNIHKYEQNLCIGFMDHNTIIPKGLTLVAQQPDVLNFHCMRSYDLEMGKEFHFFYIQKIFTVLILLNSYLQCRLTENYENYIWQISWFSTQFQYTMEVFSMNMRNFKTSFVKSTSFILLLAFNFGADEVQLPSF